MTRWTEMVMSHMYPWPIGVLFVAAGLSLLTGVAGAWSLWRARRLLAALPTVERRLETLSNSVSLLSETTESCFKALSMQMQFMQAQNGRPFAVSAAAASRAVTGVEDMDMDEGERDTNDRQARQRRMVGAAKRGEAIRTIAAREDVAESEVALRLHVNRAAQAQDGRSHGALLS